MVPSFAASSALLPLPVALKRAQMSFSPLNNVTPIFNPSSVVNSDVQISSPTFGAVASLSGSARIMGQVFPGRYFQQISIGAFTKALGFADLTISLVELGVLIVGYLLVTLVLLKTQEG